jgi:hypothetical protein
MDDSVIIINDDDGHTHCFAATDVNMRKLLRDLAKLCNEFDVYGQEKEKITNAAKVAKDLLAKEIFDVIQPCINSRHGKIQILKIEKKYEDIL